MTRKHTPGLGPVFSDPVKSQTVYGIGRKNEDGGFGMTYGPTPELSEMLEISPTEPGIWVIIRFNPDDSADIVWKWVDNSWEEIFGTSPAKDGPDFTRCPKCGAAHGDSTSEVAHKFDCGTWAIYRPEGQAWEWQHSTACTLLVESVVYIHELEDELETMRKPPKVTHQSAENALPVKAYFPARPNPPESLQKLRAKAEVFLGMASQAFSVVTHQDHHPDPDRLRRVYGPDMKRAVQQLADLREEVLLFIDLIQAPRR